MNSSARPVAAYAVAWLALFLLGQVFANLALHHVAVLLFPLPVALGLATGAPVRSIGYVVAAALVGATAVGPAGGAFFYTVGAASGWLLGYLYIQRWSFGRVVAVMTTVVFAGVLATLARDWFVWRRYMSMYWESAVASVRESTRSPETTEMLVESIRYFDRNWEFMGVGVAFGSILIGVTAVVGIGSAFLRRVDSDAGTSTRFRDVRPPEHLVWLAIAVAIAWLVDNRWHDEVLRLVTWNGALGLAAVYWLAGFAIVLYTLAVANVNVFLSTMLILFIFYLGLHPIVCSIGFFDTWWNFRARVDRLAAQRASDGDGPEN